MRPDQMLSLLHQLGVAFPSLSSEHKQGRLVMVPSRLFDERVAQTLASTVFKSEWQAAAISKISSSSSSSRRPVVAAGPGASHMMTAARRFVPNSWPRRAGAGPGFVELLPTGLLQALFARCHCAGFAPKAQVNEMSLVLPAAEDDQHGHHGGSDHGGGADAIVVLDRQLRHLDVLVVSTSGPAAAALERISSQLAWCAGYFWPSLRLDEHVLCHQCLVPGDGIGDVVCAVMAPPAIVHTGRTAAEPDSKRSLAVVACALATLGGRASRPARRRADAGDAKSPPQSVTEEADKRSPVGQPAGVLDPHLPPHPPVSSSLACSQRTCTKALNPVCVCSLCLCCTGVYYHSTKRLCPCLPGGRHCCLDP